jgi:3-keto steroid reductase
VFNAGGMSVTGIDWVNCIKQLCTDPLEAISYPKYKVQVQGEMSADGYGATWMGNVFGHFIMVSQRRHHLHYDLSNKFQLQELQATLRMCPAAPARVLWMSSQEAGPEFFDIRDWQLTQTLRSYEGSKHEMDLLAMASNDAEAASGGKIRHILVHPSVTVSNIFTGQLLLGTALYWIFWGLCELVCLHRFEIIQIHYNAIVQARVCGSSIHVISPINGAVSSTYAILVPISSLPAVSAPVKLGSRIHRTNSYVLWEPVKEWNKQKADASKLFDNCRQLYVAIRDRRSSSKMDGPI